MGDKTFIFDINAMGKLAPLLALSGAGAVSPMMSAFSGSNDINIESGDEVIVATLKDKNTGLYRVEALKNLSKDYHFSHLKHDSGYLFFFMIFINLLLGYLLIGVFMYFSDNRADILMNGLFVWLPLFFVGRFFGLRLFGVTKRKKLDKFIKNYVKP